MRDTPKSQSAQYLRASMYEVLGIAPTASDEEVHAAYRRVVKRAHPDAGGSQRAFLRVNAAYRVLSDAGMRRAHDLWLAHLLDAYDEPRGRSGGNRPSEGRNSPGGRHNAGGRYSTGGRANPEDTGPAGAAEPGTPGTPGAPGAFRPVPPGGPGSMPPAPAAGPRSAGSPGSPDSANLPGPWSGSAAGGPTGNPPAHGGSEHGLAGLDGPRSGQSAGGRRRSRRHSGSADARPDGLGHPGPGGAGLPPEVWAAWSDEDTVSWGSDRPAGRRYLISLALCLTLFVLAGAVVRLYSIPVALGMTAAAMLIPPLAVFAVNTSRRR